MDYLLVFYSTELFYIKENTFIIMIAEVSIK